MTTTQVVMKIAVFVVLSVTAAALLGRATRSVTLPIRLRAAIASLLLSWTPSLYPHEQPFVQPSALHLAGYFLKERFIAEYHYFAFAAMLTLCLSFLAYWHFAQSKGANLLGEES